MPTTETIIDQATSSNAMPRDEQARHRVLRDASVMPCILSSFFADPNESSAHIGEARGKEDRGIGSDDKPSNAIERMQSVW